MNIKLCKNVAPGFSTYRLGESLIGSIRQTSNRSYCVMHAPTREKRYFANKTNALSWLDKQSVRNYR